MTVTYKFSSGSSRTYELDENGMNPDLPRAFTTIDIGDILVVDGAEERIEEVKMDFQTVNTIPGSADHNDVS